MARTTQNQKSKKFADAFVAATVIVGLVMALMVIFNKLAALE